MISNEPKYRYFFHYQLHELACNVSGQTQLHFFLINPLFCSNIPLICMHYEISLLLPYTFGGEPNQ